MTLRTAAHAVSAGLGVWLCVACADDATLPPQVLPHRLEVGRTVGWPALAADLDLDGSDEIILTYEPGVNPTRPVLHGVMIVRGGDALGQTNFPGTVVGASVLDTDDDGLPEVLVPFARNDSLFVTGLDGRARPKFSFFITTGEPRVEPEGTIPWDPHVPAFHVADVDGDGRKDLVTLMNTSYARLPRGVFIHRLPDGGLIDRIIIGAPSIGHVIADFDGDGIPEIASAATATDNGASAGGYADRHSYFIVFALNPLRVQYARSIGELGTVVHLAYGDFDGDGVAEVLLASSTKDDKTASLELLDPVSWQVRRRRDFPRPLGRLATADIDRDARPDILVIQPPDTLLLVNGELDVLRRKRLPNVNVIEVVDDVDGDGVPEILAFAGSDVWLLGPDLAVRAVLRTPEDFGRRLADLRWSGTVRRGPGRRSQLILMPGNRTTLYHLVPNPLWPVHRWGIHAVAIAAALTLLAGGLALLRLRGRARALAALNTLALEDDVDGLLRIRSGGRVLWSNRTLQRWLGAAPAGARRTDALRPAAPELAAFCARILDAVPARHMEDSGALPGGAGRRAAYIAEPLPGGRDGAREWLVRVRDVTERRELQEARTWTLLAQRVAHDLKNPLTSLLLTLQRLVMEYQARAPELAPDLDEYAVRMEQRIAQLRAMTANFMKFVEADEPEPRDVPLNDLVRQAAKRISRGLARDIRLIERCGAERPVVRVDPEQFGSVLENLVANAVNAMPDGGSVTLATGVNRGIRLLPGGAAADWAVLEVLDTGSGIPGELLELIFDPGFSCTENGSGLGLTIVRRIVERHGGRIYVESEMDTGSVFSIYLPLAGRLDVAVNEAILAEARQTVEP